MGLLYLAAYLGGDTKVYDGPMEMLPEGYDIYGLSCVSPQYPIAKEYLTYIKRRAPTAQVTIGGPHASGYTTGCVSAGFDYVVVGAGEGPLKMLMQGLVKKEPVPKILLGDMGVATLDQLPFPDRSAINLREYVYYIDGQPTTTLITSRGCHKSCAFCANTWGKAMSHGYNYVEHEVETIREQYGFHSLMFFDDSLLTWKGRAYSILNVLMHTETRFRCFARADQIDSEMAPSLKNAGCVEVGMGIESGSDAILKTINKGETVSQVKDAVVMLQNEGIRVKGFFILGLPGESPETLAETRKFLEEVPLDDHDFTIFVPYAGSHIARCNYEYDLEWEYPVDLSQAYYKGKPGEYKSLVWTSKLTKEQITDARNTFEQDFKRWLS